ncbi:hypothetical protein [Enterobacter phage N5822]|nr:hypothetical protein [Enterobacter phage N5822]QPD96230.1 hypothetical protein [Enterobacter phage N5822]
MKIQRSVLEREKQQRQTMLIPTIKSHQKSSTIITITQKLTGIKNIITKLVKQSSKSPTTD